MEAAAAAAEGIPATTESMEVHVGSVVLTVQHFHMCTLSVGCGSCHLHLSLWPTHL